MYCMVLSDLIYLQRFIVITRETEYKYPII